ncbi:MAG TPA: CHRD domain-containing protein [Acidimicrobiales bacterium]|nr:CHRD domain-containing protein [Acidimicrobiales bacterium]
MRRALLLLVSIALAAAGCGQADGGDVAAGDGRGMASLSANRPAGQFDVELTGAAVVGGQGHPTGSGAAVVTLQPTRGELCYRIDVDGVDEVTSAHLFEGKVGVVGGVVLNLQPPAGGSVDRCVTAPSALLTKVAATPAAFSLHLRTVAHPEGALRGHLRVD